MATKNQQELLDYLGPQYFLRNIDGEPCICRNINTRYDLEISGTAKKKHSLDVYVWDISRGTGTAATIVEQITDISDKEMLKQTLIKLIEKYSD